VSSIKERREKLQTIWADTPWDDIAAFIGPNAEKFRPGWKRQQKKILEKGYANDISFCWPAFFLAYVWFFYRKQWAAGALLFGLPVVIIFLFPSAKNALGGVSFAMALMGKGLYLQESVRKTAKISAAEPDDAARHAALAAAGGISWPAGIVSGMFFALSAAAAIISILH
jgi:hypothetical protein